LLHHTSRKVASRETSGSHYRISSDGQQGERVCETLTKEAAVRRVLIQRSRHPPILHGQIEAGVGRAQYVDSDLLESVEIPWRDLPRKQRPGVLARHKEPARTDPTDWRILFAGPPYHRLTQLVVFDLSQRCHHGSVAISRVVPRARKHCGNNHPGVRTPTPFWMLELRTHGPRAAEGRETTAGELYVIASIRLRDAGARQGFGRLFSVEWWHQHRFRRGIIIRTEANNDTMTCPQRSSEPVTGIERGHENQWLG